MQAQDDASLVLFKLWPKIEEKKNTIFACAGVVLAGAFVVSFVSWHGEQKQLAAGQAMTQALMSPGVTSDPKQLANSMLAVANDHAGTDAALRARLQGATALYADGNYSAAQSEYQKVLDIAPETFFKATALLGIAASEEAQGKDQDAITTYLRAAQYKDTASSQAANFALGRLYEAQGKLNDAVNYYSQAMVRNEIGNEANLRRLALQAKLATAEAATATVSANTNAPTIQLPMSAPTGTPAKP